MPRIPDARDAVGAQYDRLNRETPTTPREDPTRNPATRTITATPTGATTTRTIMVCIAALLWIYPTKHPRMGVSY